MTVLEWAEWYVAAGLSVIPVRADGSKAPAHADWRQYTDRLPTPDELANWFAGGDYGIGVVPGAASGNLSVFDFECRNGVSAYDLWLGVLPASEREALQACPIVATPSGGRHVWVRSAVPHKGRVLARDTAGLIMVEIRGVGHQVLAPGCPDRCHRSGKPYQFVSRGWLPAC